MTSPQKDVDGGWAWIVLVASYVNLMLCSGFSIISGFIQIILLEEFQGSVAMTSWITALFAGSMQMAGPLSSLVANRYSCRTSVILGGVFMSAGFVISSLADSLTVLFLSMGVTAGIGLGLTYTPSIVVVSYFFQKRRAIANGLILSGSGFGILVSPQVARILYDNFTWRETFVILGAASAHVCVSGALMFSCHEQAARRGSNSNKKDITDTTYTNTKGTMKAVVDRLCCYGGKNNQNSFSFSRFISVLSCFRNSNSKKEEFRPSNQEYTTIETKEEDGNGTKGVVVVEGGRPTCHNCNVGCYCDDNDDNGDDNDNESAGLKQLSILSDSVPHQVDVSNKALISSSAAEDNNDGLISKADEDIKEPDLLCKEDNNGSSLPRAFNSSARDNGNGSDFEKDLFQNNIDIDSLRTQGRGADHEPKAAVMKNGLKDKILVLEEANNASSSSSSNPNIGNIVSAAHGKLPVDISRRRGLAASPKLVFNSHRHIDQIQNDLSHIDERNSSSMQELGLHSSQLGKHARPHYYHHDSFTNSRNFEEHQQFLDIPKLKMLKSLRDSEAISMSSHSGESLHRDVKRGEGISRGSGFVIVSRNPSLLSGLVASTQQLDLIVCEKDEDLEKLKRGNFMERNIVFKTPETFASTIDTNNIETKTGEHNNLMDSTTEVGDKTTYNCGDTLDLSKIEYPSLYRNQLFWVINLALFVYNAGCGLFNIHAPSFFEVTQGWTPQQVTNLFSLYGVMTLLGRVFSGALANATKDLDLLLFIMMQIIGGLSIILVPSLGTTYVSSMLLVSVLSFHAISTYALLPTLTIQYVGIQHLATAFGIEMVFSGMGYLVAPPLAGTLVDLTGSYVYSMYISGSMFLVGGMILFVVPHMLHTLRWYNMAPTGTPTDGPPSHRTSSTE